MSEFMKTCQVQIVMPSHVNGTMRLFGGQLMEWIDVTAAVEARRHALSDVTLAAVDPLEFIAPVHLNDTVLIIASVTWTGKTSMEVQVDTFVEHLSQKRELVNRAHLVFVAVDEAGRPQPVPPLEPKTERDKRAYEAAQRRRAWRLKLKEKMNEEIAEDIAMGDGPDAVMEEIAGIET